VTLGINIKSSMQAKKSNCNPASLALQRIIILHPMAEKSVRIQRPSIVVKWEVLQPTMRLECVVAPHKIHIKL